MTAPPVHQSWAIAVHETLIGFRDVLMAQVIPGDDRCELVLTTRDSPPAPELVELLRERLGPVLRRDDSPLDPGRGAAWCFYPALTDDERQLFRQLDWRRAVVLHEWLD
jgi:hypothetical protein